MAIQDTGCSLAPYFQINNGCMDEFKTLCERFVDKTASEEKCQYYGFSFNGTIAHCRESYQDAEGLLTHLDNVDSLLQEALKISELLRLEIHGPEQELAKLREPLKDINPQFFVVEYGFRR